MASRYRIFLCNKSFFIFLSRFNFYSEIFNFTYKLLDFSLFFFKADFNFFVLLLKCLNLFIGRLLISVYSYKIFIYEVLLSKHSTFSYLRLIYFCVNLSYGLVRILDFLNNIIKFYRLRFIFIIRSNYGTKSFYFFFCKVTLFIKINTIKLNLIKCLFSLSYSMLKLLSCIYFCIKTNLEFRHVFLVNGKTLLSIR